MLECRLLNVGKRIYCRDRRIHLRYAVLSAFEPMICFIVARRFEFTLKPLLSDPFAPRVTPLFYDETLRKHALAKATYIFADLDRLSAIDLIRAARLYRRLQESGCRV